MATSLSKLVDNLRENIHNNKCDKCKSNLCFVRAMNETLLLKCIDCEKEYEKGFNKELLERFSNTYEFCGNDLNKFLILLRKGVYPYEYMDGSNKFNEKALPGKESFYSSLTMEDISETDYAHANNVFKKFNLNNLGEYHDLYVNTLLLADVFENVRYACMKNYQLDPAHFISLPGLAWQACLKKTDVELELLTDYDMLLMIQEGIRGGICHAIKRYAKANNKYMRNYGKNKESSYIQYLDTNNLYGKAMTEKLPARGFRWMNDISRMDEEFVRIYDKNDIKVYILEMDVDYPNELQNLHSDFPFLAESIVINRRNKLVSEANYHTMKLIDDNLAIIEMRKVKVKMNKPIYLGLSILEISKITMYEFWYDYVKSKYGNRVRLCYMDTDSFVINIKTKDFYKDIAENIKERFDTSNYIYDRPLPTGVNKKVVGLMKDELGGGIITEFTALRPKAYSYKMDDFTELKKAKGTKKCVVKKMLRFDDYKNCLFTDSKVLRPQQRFRSENHSVYTENINKIALSCNDDKRIVAADGISSHPYGYVLN